MGIFYFSNYDKQNKTCAIRILCTAEIPGPAEVNIPAAVTKDGTRYEVARINQSLNCSAIEVLILPETIKEIAANAFAQCENISKIYYLGTAAQWEEIKKATNWDGHFNYELIILGQDESVKPEEEEDTNYGGNL